MKHIVNKIDKILGILIGVFTLAALSQGFYSDALEVFIMTVLSFAAIRLYVRK